MDCTAQSLLDLPKIILRGDCCVEQITLMLTETDLTVSQIADLLGYTDAPHIARYFRRERSMSPQAFRRTYGRN